jgi:ABC-type oligopeptide transport system ATPase subunit
VSEVLRVENLRRWYSRARRLGRKRSWTKSLTDVSFHIAENEIVGLIGESGCGKSTLARSLLWMEPIQSGSLAERRDGYQAKSPGIATIPSDGPAHLAEPGQRY